MSDAPMKPSDMIAAVRLFAARARFEDLRGEALMAKATVAGERDDLPTMNALHDQAVTAWSEMERILNVLIPLLVSLDMDQILARLQAAFDADGQ